MINHEFRTPLTTVVTGAELLKEGHILDDEMRYAILDDMTRDGKRLEELIDQMLTVARVENFGLGLTLREYRFSSLWDDIQAGHHSLKLAAKPSFGEEMVINTDPAVVRTIIASLVDNALKHGASTVRLRVSLSEPFTPDVVAV